MQRYASWARDNEGRSYPSATVSVYLAGTSTLAQIYSENGPTYAPVGKSNPFLTSADGYWAFAAPDGVYDIQVMSGSGVIQSIPNLSMADVEENYPAPNWIDFIEQVVPPSELPGRLFYNGQTHTLSFYNDIASTSLELGAEVWIRARNRTGTPINDGSVVYIDGATGQTPTIQLAISTVQTANQVIGLATHTFLDQQEGWVTVTGRVNGIDTSSLVEGSAVYLSDSVPGAMTSVAPDNAIQVGICIYAHPIHGKILVRTDDANSYVKTSSLSLNAKTTPEGGDAILLINRTGSPSVKGECLSVSGTHDMSVRKIVVDDASPIGVFYESGVADGAPAWVVKSGIAECYFVGSTTRGHIARGFLTADGGAYVPGQLLSEPYPVAPFASDKHFFEIGHVLESRVGPGLAKVNLHFN